MKSGKSLSVLGFIILFCLGLGTHLAAEEEFTSSPPLPEALEALESSSDVEVSTVTVEEWGEEENYYFLFNPKRNQQNLGFIIYPGGLVDPRSYAPTAHEIAAVGYPVVIVKMPGDIAFYTPNRAKEVIADFPDISKWVIGGHSLGGVASCAFVRNNAGQTEGVVLWASYPSETFRLDEIEISVYSIYGSKDGLATVEKIDDSRQHLPADTEFVKIIGGNHTQFGYYDTSPDPVQKGDLPADITMQEQQKQIIEATLKLLDSISGRKPKPCAASYLLGADDPRLDILRKFRDENLSQSDAGLKIIERYYEESGNIIEVCERNGFAKFSYKTMLEALIPLIEVLN